MSTFFLDTYVTNQLEAAATYTNHRIIQLLYIHIYNLDILVWLVKFVRLHILDCMYDFKARKHTTEDRMLLVEPGRRICRDEKLRSIGCWTRVRHADSIRSDDDKRTD